MKKCSDNTDDEKNESEDYSFVVNNSRNCDNIRLEVTQVIPKVSSK